MYVTIRRYKTEPGAAPELARRVNQGFVPIISRAPGFIAYYVIDTGYEGVASVSIFEDQAGADESSRMASDWVKANIASLVSGPPDITAGMVTVHMTV
jgi:heme-degrading monooxygenase HmoA